jgi:hypothetical protein
MDMHIKHMPMALMIIIGTVTGGGMNIPTKSPPSATRNRIIRNFMAFSFKEQFSIAELR